MSRRNAKFLAICGAEGDRPGSPESRGTQSVRESREPALWYGGASQGLSWPISTDHSRILPAHIEFDMSIDITLRLPEPLVENAERFGRATQRGLEAVLAEALEMIWPTLGSPAEDPIPPVSSLSDAEVLELADSEMDAAQNERLGELQKRGKASGLAHAERLELMALLQIYQLGQLRKSEGLAEAVRRGLLRLGRSAVGGKF